MRTDRSVGLMMLVNDRCHVKKKLEDTGVTEDVCYLFADAGLA